jgi:Aromatic amino acid lyase
MITLASHHDLTREAVEAVAWGGEPLALAPAALERVAAGQAGLAALLASGTRVYGVTTGTGWLASVDLGWDATGDHQRDLLLGRAVGGPPWLEAAEARALLVARLGNLISGHAGVGPGLQAPVSFRVPPQVLAQLRRTLGRLDEDVRRPSWPASACTACSTAASAGSPTSSAPIPGR